MAPSHATAFKATSKVPKLVPSSTLHRDSNPELGSPTRITQYNKKTGRPIRKSAGKHTKAAGFIDSTFLEIDEDEAYDEQSSEESDDSMTISKRKDKRRQKRKRSSSPAPPELDPIEYSQELDELTDNESSEHYNTPKKPRVTLQFNVPLGFHGPLFVKLDRSIIKENEDGVQHDMQHVIKTPQKNITPQKAAARRKFAGFTDLPPELRNAIYRHLFVRKGRDLKIPQSHGGEGLALSGQFLRVCKLVYNEGCSILYGENTFNFHRHHDVRAPFWDATPREIGYQDFLHFLKKAGPENVQYLRDIKIVFEDAMPRLTRSLNNETRRFIIDEYLLNCLRILRQAKLRTIGMKFYGRRQVSSTDVRFLSYLEQIKADEVSNDPERWFVSKMPHYVFQNLKDNMTRTKKLYEEKK